MENENAVPADDASKFFDAGSGAANGTQPPEMTEEEKEEMRNELKKTEDEIQTLRQVLQARMRHAGELKRKLGLTPWVEWQQDLGQTLKSVRDTNAFQKTTGVVHSTSDAITSKLGQLKNSTAFKSFEDRVGTAYSSVKAKIAASTSIDQLYGHTNGGTGSQPPTNPTTPIVEEKNTLS